MAKLTKELRRLRRETLAALDDARSMLRSDVGDPALREAYDRAVEAYWSCRKIRNSRRAGIKVTE